MDILVKVGELIGKVDSLENAFAYFQQHNSKQHEELFNQIKAVRELQIKMNESMCNPFTPVTSFLTSKAGSIMVVLSICCFASILFGLCFGFDNAYSLLKEVLK